jgi:2-dehydropantoate 2-reductase
MNFNEIIVIGAGVIGSCYGALLSQKNNVILIDNKEVTDRIDADGVTLINDVEKKFFPKAKINLKKVLPNTLILLTTKAHQSENAVQQINHLLQDDTVILILQNGLGNEEIIRGVVEDRVEVIRGIVNSGAWQVEPGKLNLILRETVLEPTTDTASVIVQLFNDSGLPARVAKDFISELWQKLVLNCVLNPLTAILRVRNYQIGTPGLKKLRYQIVEECLTVSKAEGVDLPPNLADAIDKAIQGYTNFSSMYQDITNGKKTEIDFLNGKIVQLAKKHSISTPCNEALTAMIKFLEPENELG